MALHGVGADARQSHTRAFEFGIRFAKLAKFAHSAGGAIEDVEEEHQRLPPHELAKGELARGRGQRQVGNRLIDEMLERMSDHGPRIMVFVPVVVNRGRAKWARCLTAPLPADTLRAPPREPRLERAE